jgi:hypothetical protein
MVSPTELKHTSTAANFDFNCEYLKNASFLSGIIVYLYSLYIILYLKYGLLTGSGTLSDYLNFCKFLSGNCPSSGVSLPLQCLPLYHVGVLNAKQFI